MPTRSNKPAKLADVTIPKAGLAQEIVNVIEERNLTQLEAAHLIREAPSQISLITTGKLTGFSAQRLIRTLAGLGRDVDIVIRKSDRGRAGSVRLVVK